MRFLLRDNCGSSKAKKDREIIRRDIAEIKATLSRLEEKLASNSQAIVMNGREIFRTQPSPAKSS